MRISRSSWAPRRVDHAGPAAVIAALVDAERATTTSSDPEALGHCALTLSGADTVWLSRGPGAVVVRTGHRGRDDEVRAMIDAGVRAPSVAGLSLHPLGGGATIVFAADRAPLLDAVADWACLRLTQRSVAGESERAARAELRALRAQISPHFAFNAMAAIAALIRIDPERARALLLDFADYTRYSFGSHGEYTTLAEELRSIEIYLSLERARFGDRLRVRVTVPPELLNVPVPFLVLQPLVENAVRHGIEPQPGGGTVRLVAEDAGASVHIEIEDDGAGADAERLEDLLAGKEAHGAGQREHVGLRNIDERLRAVYGDEHGLVVETAPGAGTKVIVSIPKFRPGVLA